MWYYNNIVVDTAGGRSLPDAAERRQQRRHWIIHLCSVQRVRSTQLHVEP